MGTRADAKAVCRAWDNSECVGTEDCPPRCPRFFDREGEPLLIRPYEPADFDGLVAMYEAIDAYSRTMGLPPATSDGIERWIDRLTDEGGNLVALDDGRVIGHIAAVPLAVKEPQFVVFVHQDYQGRGVGTELIKQLVAYAAEAGDDALRLDVATGNRRAIAVYDNLGFEVTERLAAELSMRLPLDHPLAERVRKPPAERD